MTNQQTNKETYTSICPIIEEKKKEFEKVFWDKFEDTDQQITALKSFLLSSLRESYEQGYAARGGVESAQKQRMFEAGKELGRKEVNNLKTKCRCACHNSFREPLEHDSRCCEFMNGVIKE